ncbi:hypothetical protein [Maribacter sp. 2307ULW6-5]|uniref:hypothetical protein n=1 Tax=Maribacter sp. 2307ULW6-5 TaxID=3386275 RepID=UPI0039BD62D3
MKKVVSSIAVAIMLLGLATTAINNAAQEVDFLNDWENLIACGNCSQTEDFRRGKDGRLA